MLVSDPAGAGLVDSLAQPGGNLTGFMNFEYGSSAKWLDLLKHIAPDIKRAAVLRDRSNPAGTAQFGIMQAAASSLGVELSPINVRDASEIERGIAVGAIEERPVARPASPPGAGGFAGGVSSSAQIVARPMMTMTLTCDHRTIDGATAADFLRTVKEFLEEPGLTL